jgi:hypothetical protein
MMLRWVAAGILEAVKGFRRVKGYADMTMLVAVCPGARSGPSDPARVQPRLGRAHGPLFPDRIRDVPLFASAQDAMLRTVLSAAHDAARVGTTHALVR